MSRAHDRARHHRTPSFYERALAAGDSQLLDEAREVEGIDEEIALLRVEIRRLLAEPPDDPRVLQAGIRLLAQALVTRHRLTGAEAETLTDTATSLLERFVAAFAGDDLHA